MAPRKRKTEKDVKTGAAFKQLLVSIKDDLVKTLSERSTERDSFYVSWLVLLFWPTNK